MEIQEITAYKVNDSVFQDKAEAERYKYAISRIEVGDRVCTNRSVGWCRLVKGGSPAPIFAYGIVEEIWELEEYLKLVKTHSVEFTQSLYFAGSKARVIFFRNPDEKHLKWVKIETELHKI